MSSTDTAAKGVDLARRALAERGARVSPDASARGRNYLEVITPSGSRNRVYVKTRSTGTWQTDIRKGQPRAPEQRTHEFWLFVDFTTAPAEFLVAPEWWVENDIYETHQKYLARHGGRRRDTPSATHHAIPLKRIEQWRDRWDLLGL